MTRFSYEFTIGSLQTGAPESELRKYAARVNVRSNRC